jgi:hypothetical protein
MDSTYRRNEITMVDYDNEYEFDDSLSAEEHASNAMGQGFDPVPEDEYDLVCDSAEWKDSKTPGNAYLNLKWKILGGEYENRVIFQMVHLINKSAVAKKAAQAELSGMMIAAGWDEKRKPKAQEIAGFIVKAKVVVGDEYEGKRGNDIEFFIAGSTATAPTAVNTATQSTPTDKGDAPW